MHYAVALIETLAARRRGGRRTTSVLSPGDISLLYPKRRPDAALTALCDRLHGFTRTVQAGR
jgi:hypothetical protein